MGEKKEREMEGDRTGDKSGSIEISPGNEAWHCREEERGGGGKPEKVFLCVSSEQSRGPFCSHTRMF